MVNRTQKLRLKLSLIEIINQWLQQNKDQIECRYDDVAGSMATAAIAVLEVSVIAAGPEQRIELERRPSPSPRLPKSRIPGQWYELRGKGGWSIFAARFVRDRKGRRIMTASGKSYQKERSYRGHISLECWNGWLTNYSENQRKKLIELTIKAHQRRNGDV